MISPTQYAVRTQAYNAELERARLSKTISAMQVALQKLTQLNAAYFGRPNKAVSP
jgi:hypothetical protein